MSVGEDCPTRSCEARSRGQGLAWPYNPSNHKPDFILFLCQGWDGSKSDCDEESAQRLDLHLLCFLLRNGNVRRSNEELQGLHNRSPNTDGIHLKYLPRHSRLPDEH